jgi:PAP2 superfamily
MEWLPWQDAVIIAVVTAGITLAFADRRSPFLRGVTAWTRELTIMFALYGLWQLAGTLSLAQPGDAINRGRDIVRVERWAHLPSEASVQRLVLGDHTLIRWMNVYYAGLHVAALGLCLVWLFVRHRDRYPAVRNVLALVTGASLLVQFVPVAPPRLIPGSGLIDTGHVFGPSVYPSTVAPGLDQLSAMPSLHVGWAVVVAGAVIYALRSPWRWLAVLYPAMTWWVVIVTGNHYWADGIVELAICALAFLLVRALTPTARRLTEAEQQTSPVGASIAGAGCGHPGHK